MNSIIIIKIIIMHKLSAILFTVIAATSATTYVNVGRRQPLEIVTSSIDDGTDENLNMFMNWIRPFYKNAEYALTGTVQGFFNVDVKNPLYCFTDGF